MQMKPDLTTNMKPQFVSMARLRKILMPFMSGIKNAEDDLQDLWRMGAPSPLSHEHPCSRVHTADECRRQKAGLDPCEPHACYYEKRLLLPAQFATWWTDIAARQGLELKAGDAFIGKGKIE